MARSYALDNQPSAAQMEAFQGLFDYFNEKLFGNRLPACILNFSRDHKAHGFFWANRWLAAEPVVTNPIDFTDEDSGEVVTVEIAEPEVKKMLHEISLCPESLGRCPKDVLGTLVHEMCHLEREVTGKPSRGGYHDKKWAEMMLNVGLTPRSIDNPGKMTGQKVTHDIDENGAYDLAYQALPAELLLPFKHVPHMGKGKSKTKDKVKYTCPECEAKMWGKPDQNLICGDCFVKYQTEEEEGEEPERYELAKVEKEEDEY